MLVVIAGAHGKIARKLIPLLSERGHGVRGIIRNPDHADDVRADGAAPVVCDLESADAAEIEEAVRDADAVVFAAGAGPGSGAERKWTVDRDAARQARQRRPGGRRRALRDRQLDRRGEPAGRRGGLRGLPARQGGGGQGGDGERPRVDRRPPGQPHRRRAHRQGPPRRGALPRQDPARRRGRDPRRRASATTARSGRSCMPTAATRRSRRRSTRCELTT